MKITRKDFYFPEGEHEAIDKHTRITVDTDGTLHGLGIPNPMPDVAFAIIYEHVLGQAIAYITSGGKS